MMDVGIFAGMLINLFNGLWKPIACLVLMMNGISVYSQFAVAEQEGGWYMYFGNHRISERIGIHTEYQWRRTPVITNWQQSLLRFGLDYHTKSGAMLTPGYAWIRTYPYGSQPIAYRFNEHRIWQQLLMNQDAGRFYFQHRYRLEQRFLERKSRNVNSEFEADEHVFRQRARYRLFVSIPLTRRTLEDNTLFLGLYDEVFLNFGGGTAKDILDQNRLYASLGWRFNGSFNIQAGYLNHYVFKPDGIRAELNHTWQFAVFYNLDFRSAETIQ